MIKPTFAEEKKWWQKGYLVVGVDEVGRGAFAGPVVAGAVAIIAGPAESTTLKVLAAKPPKLRLGGGSAKVACSHLRNSSPRHPLAWESIGIDDSKRLTPKKREALAEIIKKDALAYGIGEVGVAYINKYGIVKATARAMRAAVGAVRSDISHKSDISHISNKKVFVLVDAFHVKYVPGVGLKNQKAIVKGDQKSLSIAAASIIAKVHRDKLMRRLSKKHRLYGWGKNKGYGTAGHREAIKRHGITRLHRKAFVDGTIS